MSQQTCDGGVWALIVEADEIRRWTSRDCTLTLRGVELVHRTGLAADDVTVTLDGGAQGTTIAIRAEADEVPAMARWIARGMVSLVWCPIRDGNAELREGITVAGGRVGDVEIDPEIGGISVSLRPLEQIDTSDLCPPSRAVDGRTWPSAPDDAQGSRVPFVYGAPGAYEYSEITDVNATASFDFSDPAWWSVITFAPSAKTATAGATPAIAADSELQTVEIPIGGGTVSIDLTTYPLYLIACQGHTAATSVEMWIQSDTVGLFATQRDLIKTQDGLGRATTLVDITDASNLFRGAGEWWLAWRYGGAIEGTDGGGLGDIVEIILGRAEVPVDWRSVQRAKSYLNRFTVGGYVDGSVSALAWCTDRLPTYGARLVWSLDGAGVVVTVPDPDAAPICALTVGVGVQRSAPYLLAPGDLDEVAVTWAQARGVLQRQRMTVVRRPGPVVVRDEVTAGEVWDDASAARVAGVALWVHGSSETMALQLDVSRWWWLREGDVIDLTDPTLGLVGGPSSRWQVSSAVYSDGPLRTLSIRRIDRAPDIVVSSGDGILS